MGRTAQLAGEFAARNVKPLGLSTDSVEEHLKWIEDVNDTQNTTLRFPIVADKDRRIAELYDMIHPGQSETAAVRSVFIIDPNMKIRLTMTYPMNVGRNFAEILRVINALQLGDKRPRGDPRRLDARRQGHHSAEHQERAGQGPVSSGVGRDSPLPAHDAGLKRTVFPVVQSYISGACE